MLEAAVFCIALTVYYEARNEPQLGQVAVANVVMNRANWRVSRVCNEVIEPFQFSPFIHPVLVPPVKDKSWLRAQKIARHVIQKGKTWDVTGGATHFYNPALADPSWALVCEPRVTIVNHHFCFIGKGE